MEDYQILERAKEIQAEKEQEILSSANKGLFEWSEKHPNVSLAIKYVQTSEFEPSKAEIVLVVKK